MAPGPSISRVILSGVRLFPDATRTRTITDGRLTVYPQGGSVGARSDPASLRPRTIDQTRPTDDHLDVLAGAALPIVLPCVISESAAGWTSTLQFRDLLNADPRTFAELGADIPDFRRLLDDLSQVSNEALRARASQLFAYDGSHGDVLELCRNLHELFQTDNGPQAFSRIISYLLLVADEPVVEPVRGTLRRIAPETATTIMTIAEKLVQQGIEKGSREAKREMLRRLLEFKFGALPAGTLNQINTMDVLLLERSLEGVSTAESIDAILTQ